ncbi:MAG: YeiH family protein [Kiritimatiellia bacterium]|jgi:uncharacterized integral membrane protein (TIGR00698 family)
MTFNHSVKSTFVLFALKRAAYLILAVAFFALPWAFKGFRNYASGAAIVAGLLFALLVGNPFAARTGKLASPLLGAAIVMMGAGLDLKRILKTGASGLGYTVVGIAFAFAFGIFLGKRLKLERDTNLLICSGTAICGGSAIAAVASAIKAKASDVAIATAVVFVLNAVALLIFPPIGRALGFTQEQFGLWSAVAIHDTSSVVGATMQYGEKALEVGATVKLARALWIVPVALVISLAVSRSEATGGRAKLKIPWFIPGFILAAAVVAWFPSLAGPGKFIGGLSKYLMVATLFIIGSNVSLDAIRKLGFAPMLHGIVLWLVLLVGWLLAIQHGGLVE